MVFVMNTVCSIKIENGQQVERPDDWLEKVRLGNLCVHQNVSVLILVVISILKIKMYLESG